MRLAFYEPEKTSFMFSEIRTGLNVFAFNRHHSVLERTNSRFVLPSYISTTLTEMAPRLL